MACVDFSLYNDYELIYLIREGEEEAMQKLIWKYSYLIYSKLKKMYIPNNNYDDFYQEGLLILFNAIKNFDETKNVPFTIYFSKYLTCGLLSKIRKEANYLNHDYLDEHEEFVDTSTLQEESVSFYDIDFNNFTELEKLIYQEIIVKGTKPRILAEELKMDIASIYNSKQRVLKKLRQQTKIR